MSSFFDYYQNFIQKSTVNRNITVDNIYAAAKPVKSTANTNVNSATTIAVPESSTELSKMEHSYLREHVRSDITNGLSVARTVLMRHAPQCSSCFTHPLDEKELLDSNYCVPPSYDEIDAKEAMNECGRIAKYVKNTNSDDDDWVTHINQSGWTNAQQSLFMKVSRILDYDQLARMAHEGRQHEALQRRAIIDKSASRMRRALAAIAWDPRLTQWLHSLLMDHLPPIYMASYLDIMQTLKTKLPTLTDKMLFSRPLNVSQELLAPVMKKQWEPTISVKTRQLPHNVVIVTVPTMPTSDPLPTRLQKWHKQLSSICQVVQISLPNSNDRIARQGLDQVAEIIVSMTRVKIHDLRTENPNRGIILVGFNAGAALALQVAMSESVACVICMGFAYNTMNGVRGNPDDRMLDIKVPILFVIGQNSQRSSQEEIELLRERMQSESSLVVVGSADDALRVPKSRRKLESVTQAMVDSMVVDEIYDYINKTLTNPPGPRVPSIVSNNSNNRMNKTILADGTVAKATPQHRKRKQDANDGDSMPAKTKYVPHIGRPRTRPVTGASASGGVSGGAVVAAKSPQVKVVQQTSVNDDINMAMQSILESESDVTPGSVGSNTVTNNKSQSITINPMQKPTIFTAGGQAVTTAKPTALAGTKIKMIPSNQFVHLKTLQSQSKIYTIKPTQQVAGAGTGTGTNTTIGSIVKSLPAAAASGQQQIFTLKSPNGQTTQFVTAAPQTAQQKYTVIKNPNGTTTLQLSKNINTAASTSASAAGNTAVGGSNNSGMDISNIIDMPIMFADNEGNLVDSQQGNEPANKPINTNTKPSSSSNVGKLIISHKIIKEANPTSAIPSGQTIGASTAKPNTIIINKPNTITGIVPQTPLNVSGGIAGTTNKFVYLNRNTMKPFTGNIIARSTVAGNTPTQLPQYAKIIVTNPKTAASGAITTTDGGSDQAPIVTNVKSLNLQAFKSAIGAGGNTTTVSAGTALRQGTGLISVGGKTIPQLQVINPGDKPQIRNIVLKTASGALRQIPAHLNTQLMNRNLTVRKLNILPTVKPLATTIGGSATSAAGSGGIASASVSASGAGDVTITATSVPTSQQPAQDIPTTVMSKQASPKIISINSLNATPADRTPDSH